MSSTSVMSGTSCSTNVPSARVVAAISFSAEFFAPLMGTTPSSGPLGRTMMRVTP